MADANSIRAGKAFVELFADGTKLDKGLLAASAKLKAWGASVTSLGIKTAALGAAATAPLVAAAGIYTETASSLGKMSQRTGIAAEQLSALSYAARRSGVDAEQLEVGIKKMQKALFEAGDGSAEARKALAGVGVSLEDMKHLTPDQQVKKLADAFKAMDDPTAKTALAMKLFGKSGTDLLPFLNKGAAGIEDLEAKGRRLGNVLTGEDAQAGKEFKAVMTDLKDSLMGVTYAIGRAVIPGMTRMRNLIFSLVEQITKFARENSALFDVLFDVATGITVAGTGLVVFGKLIAFSGSGLAGLWSVVKLGAAAAIGSFNLLAGAVSFLLSPIGLVVAGVAGLIAAFLFLTETGAQVRNDLAGGWAAVAAAVTSAWGGIANAIKGGDVALAGKIAMAGLKLAWAEGVDALWRMWRGLIANLKLSFVTWLGDVKAGWLNLQYQLGFISHEQAVERFRQLQAETDKARQEVEGGAQAAPNPDIERYKRELDDLNKQAQRKADAEKFRRGKRLEVVQEKAGALGEVGSGQGTFSAFGFATQSGPSTLMQKLVDKAEEQKELLQKLLDAQRGRGAKFA